MSEHTPPFGTPPAPLSSRSLQGMEHPPASQPVPSSHGPLTQHMAPTIRFPEPGTVLTSPRGSYAVTEVLGSGAFGAVYECVGPFDQVYAVKMVRPANRPYGEVQAEWAREVQRLMSLRHPNVVYIHDAFEQGHLFYLALERCDHALSAMLGSPMQEGLVLELARQLLAAVQFLHDADIIHDDLHPGNVLITHTDRPQIKISDFGISHELRGMNAVRPSIVHHAIMAPEILASGYTTKQSDIYQVGLLLYWMLTGESAIDMQADYAGLAKQVGGGEPRKKAELLGTPLGALIAKMLRRRESFRYSTAREVWADLRELEGWKARRLFPIK
jgi:eukaryotic-like serine/threonine-protein kinase